MRHLGDFIKGATVRFAWNTSGLDGASITRGTNGTIYVYKDGTVSTEVTTGITDTEDADSLTGVHWCEIATTDAFYSVGGEFIVVLKAAGIDSKTVNVAIAQFSIQRATPMKPVVGTAQGGATGYVELPATASSTDGAYKGAMVRVKHSTGAVEVRRQSATAYVGTSRTFSVDPVFDTAPDSSSEVELYLMPPAQAANVPVVDAKYVNGTAQTAGDLAALIVVIDALIDSIKGKTDNLPSDPADASDIASAFGTVNSTLTTIAGYVDTEVAALVSSLALVKAKTDALTLAAIGQAVLNTLHMLDGNKVALDTGTDEIVIYETDGITERGRVPFSRLPTTANPLLSIGG